MFGPTFGGGDDRLMYPGISFEVSSGRGVARDGLVKNVNIISKEGEVLGDRLRECIIKVNGHLPFSNVVVEVWKLITILSPVVESLSYYLRL